MKIIFSDHAKARLKQRGISKEKVLQTVENPETRIEFKLTVTARFINENLTRKLLR